MSDTPEQTNKPGRLTPGQMLSQSRRAHGLSEEQVAKSLRLSRQYILDLENDDYRHVPAMVYLRGHFKSYAKLLGLEEAKLVGAFEAMGVKVGKDGLDRPLSGHTIPIYAETQTHKKRVMTWLGLGTILLVGAILLVSWIARSPVNGGSGMQNGTSLSQSGMPVSVVNTQAQVQPAVVAQPHQVARRALRSHSAVRRYHVERAAHARAVNAKPQTITPDYKIISNSKAE